MALGAGLDAALGVIFVYVVLCILATALQELIAAFLSARGKVLEQMLKQMLDAPTGQGAGLFRRVYDHPSIDATKTSNRPQGLPASLQDTARPSYISAQTFTLALVQTLVEGKDPAQPVIDRVKTAVTDLPPGKVKTSLQALLVDAQNDIDAFKTSVQTWYDDTMERAAGVYKRNTQYSLLVIGLVAAVVLNIDMLRIGQTIWTNPQERAAMTSAADAYLKRCVGGRTASEVLADANGEPSGVACQPPCPPAAAGQSDTSKAPAGSAQQAPGCTAADPLQLVRDTAQKLAGLTVPIGWKDAKVAGIVPFLSMIIGWLLTGIGVSLGAPFWFDLLNKVANLRGAGPKPDRADAKDGAAAPAAPAKA